MARMRRAVVLALGSFLVTLGVGCASGGCPATCGGRPRRGFIPAETAAPAPAAAPAPIAAPAPAAAVPPAPAAAPAPSAGHDHGTGLPPALDQFHGILAPLWHADAGAQRQKDTCAAMPDFQRGADAIAAAPVPAGIDAAAWTAAAADLRAKVAATSAQCAAPQAGFDAAFSALHDAYHHIVDVAHTKGA
jgi:pyruvate dehydrogenase E2 component (dihydrolipoamide acetyltransferase)